MDRVLDKELYRKAYDLHRQWNEAEALENPELLGEYRRYLAKIDQYIK